MTLQNKEGDLVTDEQLACLLQNELFVALGKSFHLGDPSDPEFARDTAEFIVRISPDGQGRESSDVPPDWISIGLDGKQQIEFLHLS